MTKLIKCDICNELIPEEDVFPHFIACIINNKGDEE